MLIALYLLASFGLAFGLQNKVPLMQRLLPEGMLQCSYCMGFWTGWVTWFLQGAPVYDSGILSTWLAVWMLQPLSGLVWSLASSATCLVLNNLVPEG